MVPPQHCPSDFAIMDTVASHLAKDGPPSPALSPAPLLVPSPAPSAAQHDLLSGLDIIPPSDDHSISPTENSIQPRAHAQHTSQHHPQHTPDTALTLNGIHGTTGTNAIHAANGTQPIDTETEAQAPVETAVKEASPTVPQEKNVVSTSHKGDSGLHPTATNSTEASAVTIPPVDLSPYTPTAHQDTAADPTPTPTALTPTPEPIHHHVRAVRRSSQCSAGGGGSPLSLMLNAPDGFESDGEEIMLHRPTKRSSMFFEDEGEAQAREYKTGNDISSQGKGVESKMPLSDSVDPSEVGAGLKRESQPGPSSTPESLSTLDRTDVLTASPARKKAKVEQPKQVVSETASMYQKIFAERDPGKRKIKAKSMHEIPMDLGADEDDSDFEDVKMDSNDEDEDMIMPDDAASEDELKPEQQEAFNDEQALLTALWQWKENDPEVCCICLGRTTEIDNVFVYCDTRDCALCVHQACYGVKTLPAESEPWLCDRCLAPPEEVVSCVCCPSKDGAFRRLIPEDPSGGWVHVVCALWLPETTMGDTENVDKISVRDIPEKNWNMTCYMCNDSQDATLGACVQCDAGQCRKCFHVTCAQAYSLLETVEDPDMADPYFMYCKQHGSADGQTRLNGWAKWVKQRDCFLKRWQEEQGRKRTQRMIELNQASSGDDESGEGLVEFFEHSYSRFKQARERRIAKERSELSRQYSIGYYLGNKIDKSRSRLELVSTKAEQALQEQSRIEMYTRNLLSSLLECANYLENASPEQLEAPLSIDTTLAWYNSLPDTSRWKSNIQGIIQTIDIDALSYDNPYNQTGAHRSIDSCLEDSEGSQRQGRSSKGVYNKLARKGAKGSNAVGKNKKSKKLHPKPTFANKGQHPIILTSSRGRLIKRDFSDPDESYSGTRGYGQGNGYGMGYHSVKIPKPIVPCSICHQLTLPEEKLALEREASGELPPLTIKVLNRMVTCDTCQRQFHPKCLDPPMARVPPRGYSWNCEDCDSSGESNASSGQTSPTTPGHLGHHPSSDLDEGLMVLADTAMTVSANSTPLLQEASPSRTPIKATSHGIKRPHYAHGSDALAVPYLGSESSSSPSTTAKEGKTKKIKLEGQDKPKLKATRPTATDKEKSSEVKAKRKIKKLDAAGGQPREAPLAQTLSPKNLLPAKPSTVAPIIRGNLRIYPPGIHVTVKPSSTLTKVLAPKEVKADSEKVPAQGPKPKVVAKKVQIAAPPSTKQEAAVVKKKVKTETVVVKGSGVKAKKQEVAAPKTKVSVTMPKKKSTAAPVVALVKAKAPKSPKAAPALIASPAPVKEKTVIRRGSLPAVPEPPPPKPKEVVKYTVGEKTKEELSARVDVEIERRDNVKFRRLRGRTLTMPAPPQDGTEDAEVAGSTGESFPSVLVASG